MKVYQVNTSFQMSDLLQQVRFTKDKSFCSLNVGDSIYESEKFNMIWVKGYIFYVDEYYITRAYRDYCTFAGTMPENDMGMLAGTIDYASFTQKPATNPFDLILIYDPVSQVYNTVDVASFGGGVGPSGATGPQGLQGIQGPAGINGSQGPQGIQGAQGLQGITGPQGPAGTTGATGPQGLIGGIGATGASGVNGANGSTGATGPQGIQGTAANAMRYMGNFNNAGEMNTKVLAGPTNGDFYHIATGFTYGVITYLTNDECVWNGSFFEVVGNSISMVAGPTGATGPQGPVGSNGAVGATGANGATGPAGATGPQGVQGNVGPAGVTGPQGIQGVQGIQGTQGLLGATGPQGLTGMTGPQGIAGTNGATGAIGTTGPQGATGPQGPAGINGTNGTTGATGPAGATGPNGGMDIVLDTTPQLGGNLDVNGRTITSASSGDVNIVPNGTGSTNFQDTPVVRSYFKDVAEVVNAMGSGSGARTVNLELGNVVTATVTAASIFTFSNPPASGRCGCVTVILTNGGLGSTFTNTRWPSGTPPTLTSSGVDILVFLTTDAGANWRGQVAQLDSR